MLTVLVILCVLIWIPILFHQISHRGFLVLLIWLLIAPVATNLVQGDTNPFFNIRTETAEARFKKNLEGMRNIVTRNIEDMDESKVRQLLEPTRLLIYSFLIVFVLGTLLRKRGVLPLDRTEILMAVFSLVLIANIFFLSDRLFYSLRIGSDVFIVPFCAYYVARRFVTSEGRLRQIMQILGYLGCYLIIIALVERMVGPRLLYRLEGPFTSEHALYYVMAVVFFAALFDSVLSPENRALPAGVRRFVLCLTPVVILLTWSRGNWVGFLSGLWLFSFLGYRLMNPEKKLGWTGIALILVAAVGFSLFAFVPVEVMEGRIAHTDSVDWRFRRWEVAAQQGIENPIFGIGLLNLRDVLYREVGSYRGTHNVFLTMFAELGLSGLLAYLAVMASLIGMGLTLYRKGSRRQDCWRGVAIIAVMIAHLTPALFAGTITATGVMLVYVYVFAGGIAGLYSQPMQVRIPGYSLSRPIARAIPR